MKTGPIREVRIQDSFIINGVYRSPVYCTECGTSLSVSAKFCSSCGSRISTAEKEQIQTEVREHREVLTSTPQNRLLYGSKDGLGNIVLIGVAFFCLFLIFKPVDERGQGLDPGLVAILGFISLACFYIALFFGYE